MRTKIKLIFLLLLWLSTATYATHIVGGSLDLTRVGTTNAYVIKLRVLRDCFNGQAEFDVPATVGMFDKATNQQVRIFNLRNPVVTNLGIVGPGCAPIPSACTEVGTYTETITLNPNTLRSAAGYYFVYMRCCRNKIIVNINQPEDAAITIYTEIPPLNIINSTPRFNNNPFTFLCTNNLFTYNFDFTDPDGDSLVYSLVTPLNGPLTRNQPITSSPSSGPYSDITWGPGYSQNTQVQGNPGLAIGRNSGEIEMNPLASGVHVAAIKVEEFRFGVKLGEVRLELQFTIVNCPANPTPTITIKNESGQPVFANNITVIAPQSVCIDIEGTDPTDSIYMTVSSPSFTDSTKKTIPTITQKNVAANVKGTTRLCWETICEYTEANKIQLTIDIKDNGCPLPRKTRRIFTINVLPMPVQNSVDILCLNFFNDSIAFNYGDSNGFSPYFNKYYLFRAVNDNNFVLFDSADKFINLYTDNNAIDNKNTNYKYFIRAGNKCGYYGPTSDTSTTFENLLVIPKQHRINTVTVVENKSLEVMWPVSSEPDFARYSLFKTTRGSNEWTFVKDFIGKQSTTYEDLDVDVQNTSYCYYVLVRDTCQHVSEQGKLACSIVLKGESNPFKHDLNWLDYPYWENGVSNYAVYREDHMTPFELNSLLSGQTTLTSDEKLNTKSGLYHYYIEAREKQSTTPAANETGNVFIARSNNIELIQAPMVYAPNAFSVNSDGLNDVMGVRDIFVKDYHLKLYNRWGQLIFETLDKNIQWDGKNQDGIPVQQDVFVYVITYTGWDSSAYTLTGNVTLLK
jgi:gliding motility-associated-like protein